MKKRILAMLLYACMTTMLLVTSALALDVPEGAVTAGDFTLWATAGGTLTEDDYSFSDADGTLRILSETAISVANADPTVPTANHIEVPAGKTVNITLAGVNIDTSGANCSAFRILSANETQTAANVTLAAGTNNVLKSAAKFAGLQNSLFSTLTISDGGSLSATGGEAAAGIGGGQSTSTAADETNTANGGTIIIEDGVITTQGGSYGAGIGDGDYAETNTVAIGSAITISGGVVTARGGSNAVDIGKGGDNSSNHTFSTGTSGTAIIYANTITDQTKLGEWCCVLFDRDKTVGVVRGEVTLDENLTVAPEQTLTIPAEQALTFSNGSTLTNNGMLYAAGTLSGQVENNGTLYMEDSSSAAITGTTPPIVRNLTGTLFLDADDEEALEKGTDYTYQYMDGTYRNNVITILTDRAITVTGSSVIDRIVIGTGVTAHLTLKDVNISSTLSASALSIGDTAALTLNVSGKNVLSSTAANCPALYIAKGSLTIEGDGSLTATSSGDRSTAIGTTWNAAMAGTITIQGDVTVTATATGNAGAGIGSGGHDGRDNDAPAFSGSVIIQGSATVNATGNRGAGIGAGGHTGLSGRSRYGGPFTGSVLIRENAVVTAKSNGANGAGIGVGGSGNGASNNVFSGTITIEGNAKVTATGGKGSAGLGCGSDAGGKIEIKGGTVVATGGTIGIGYGATCKQGDLIQLTVTGGSLNATTNLTEAQVTNGTDPVTKSELTLYSLTAETAVTAAGISDAYSYGIGGVRTDTAGKLYFWLPTGVGVSSVTAGDTEYFQSAAGTDGTLYKKRSVFYDANGGTGSVPSDAAVYLFGEAVSVSFTPQPTRNGCRFLGWSTVKSAADAEYTDGGTAEFPMGKDDVTLYAVWAPTCSVTFTKNSGTIGYTVSLDGYEGTARLLIAQYSSGRMTAVWMTELTPSDTLTGSHEFLNADETSSYKVFLVNENQAPLCAAALAAIS